MDKSLALSAVGLDEKKFGKLKGRVGKSRGGNGVDGYVSRRCKNEIFRRLPESPTFKMRTGRGDTGYKRC